MAEDRGPTSALKGRLADVFVPALVEGAMQPLTRRLGNRATIDDPCFGRASNLSSIEALLGKLAASFQGATYERVGSATGIDRDISEGLLVREAPEGRTETPIVVVAERRRLREIEVRVYYATGSEPRRTRPPLLNGDDVVEVPQIVAHVLEALRKGAVERVLAAFEETSRFVDPSGKVYAKRDGTMASFIADMGGRMELVPAAAADDGRTCCIEAVVSRQRPLQDPESGAMSFERGESGLLRELRLYYEP